MKNEEKIIKNVYAAFVVSLFMTFLPNLPAAVIAFVLFFGVMISAYILRAKSGEETLMNDHMTFIIRTIWIAGLFGILTMTVALSYLFGNLDLTVFHNCVNENGGLTATDMQTLNNIAQLCMDDYILANKGPLLTATVIGGAPLIAYMLYRISKGILRAAKGHRMGDNKSWF
ncbi:MAG TPA: hypothetical protein EYG18_05260 [Micavibrio sp.]|nr:hypothetical protein [Micavibrio sp.]HIL28657.1 hypothetical protein [Micavibrio sp.]